jgi:predicted DNA-binding protein
MDEPVKISGPQHRKYRHDPHETPLEAKKLFGNNADHACLDHIIMDIEDSERKLGYSPKITGKSTIMNVRIPNQLYKRLIELSLFMDTTKSNVARTMIETEMIDLIDLAFYREFERKLEEDTKLFFFNKPDSKSAKDKFSLIFERDGGKCRKCDSNDNIGIFHLDGNTGNFNPLNLIILCDKCLREFQRYMLRYSNKARFAAWLMSENSTHT